ncbi:MAG: hypothetical protein APR53_00180 [Methanoculleus sp. SDB]|nr:MAG: hypothetical protein APR53_00180 [Methanoculleus sp. SDB]
MTRNSLFTLCVGLLGLATLASGLADILVWIGGGPGITFGILEIAGGDFFRWGWGGAVMVFGGLFMLSGLTNSGSLQQSANVLLGTIMVGIIAGTDLFALFCESVPAGEGAPEFFNSIAGCVGGFAPPYPPAILLLPCMLGILYHICRGPPDDA